MNVYQDRKGISGSPDLARVMVDYRSDTLEAAKRNAASNGYKGALYPWTSALTGDMGDECYGAVTDAGGKARCSLVPGSSS